MLSAVLSGTEPGVTACGKLISLKPLPAYFGGVGEIVINSGSVLERAKGGKKKYKIPKLVLSC